MNAQKSQKLDQTLLWAAQHSGLRLMAYLVNNGAAVDARDYNGLTPLHLLAMSGARKRTKAKMIAYLLDQGADPNAVDARGKPPLFYAGVSEVIDTLLTRKADPNVSFPWGFVDIRNDGSYQETVGSIGLLHHSMAMGMTEKAVRLIEAGADYTAKDTRGNTPLFYCDDKQKPVIEKVILNLVLPDATKQDTTVGKKHL